LRAFYGSGGQMSYIIVTVHTLTIQLSSFTIGQLVLRPNR
jgi:hypothetical protein